MWNCLYLFNAELQITFQLHATFLAKICFFLTYVTGKGSVVAVDAMKANGRMEA